MAEADEQKIVAKYLDWIGALWFHPPNEAKRSVKLASMMKAQGLKSGVPDVCILEQRNGKGGLFVEMKFGNNKPTDDQKEWLERLSRNNYAVAVCYSAEQAIKVIKEYMNGNGYRDANVL